MGTNGNCRQPPHNEGCEKYAMSLYRKKQLIMNKKLTALFSLVIILAFIGYIIFDATKDSEKKDAAETSEDTVYNDSWTLFREIQITGRRSEFCGSIGRWNCFSRRRFIRKIS